MARMSSLKLTAQSAMRAAHLRLGGAFVSPDYVIGYLGALLTQRSTVGNDPDFGPTRTLRPLLDWHGNQIGTCRIASTWKTPFGAMHQIYATINGAHYTGRGAGEGMIFRGRRVAAEMAAQ